MPSETASPLRLTLLILTAAAGGMGVLLAYLPAAGHDQLWLLYVARQVLHGQTLYGPQLFESNPPLIVWLSMAPASLGLLAHISAAALGKALVVLLQAAVAAVSFGQLRQLAPPLTRTQMAALAFVFVTVFDVVPARDLGQRDHLLALLCLPYLLSAAQLARVMLFRSNNTLVETGPPRAVARTHPASAVLIGLVAGIGLALKPHQALIPIAVELYMVVRARSLRMLLRPEPFVIVVVAFAYIGAIRAFTLAYFTTVLPVLRDTYWAVGSLTFTQLVREAVQLHVLAATAIALHLTQRAASPASRSSAFAPVSSVLLIAGVAATLAFYLQGTGWYYQQLPAITCFAFALAFDLLPLADRRVPIWVPKATLGVALLALALTTHFMNYPFTRARSFALDTPDPHFFDDLQAGDAVTTITTTVDYTVMPAEQYGLTIAQRSPHLWMLPAILANEDIAADKPPRRAITPARLAELDRLQHQFMVEDLKRWRPRLVLVQRCQDGHCQLLEGRHTNLLGWFLRDPVFAAEWKHYCPANTRGAFDAYTLCRPVVP